MVRVWTKGGLVTKGGGASKGVNGDMASAVKLAADRGVGVGEAAPTLQELTCLDG